MRFALIIVSLSLWLTKLVCVTDLTWYAATFPALLAVLLHGLWLSLAVGLHRHHINNRRYGYRGSPR